MTFSDFCALDVSAVQLRSKEPTPSFVRTYSGEVGRKVPT